MTRAVASVALAVLLCGWAADAQVRTDGSVGAKQTLAGPNFAIGAGLGRQAGGNLYHSFAQFDLAAGESATFSGPASVRNVLARVTGGQPSLINGTIACDIPRANLFLINPSGVVFGPGAALDVRGSFAVTTADYVRMGKSERFSASPTKGELLSTASPAAFGFLQPKGNGVGMAGAMLSVQDGRAISIVTRGPVDMFGSQVRAAGGRVNVAATAGVGEVALDADRLDTPVVSTVKRLGNVNFTQDAFIDTTGSPGGKVYLLAKNVTMNRGFIGSDTIGPADGRGVDVRLSGTLYLLNGSFIRCDTIGPGAGGTVDVAADRVVATGTVGVPNLGARALGQTSSNGRVVVRAGDVSLSDGGVIGVATIAEGDAGSIIIDAARSLTLDGPDTLIVASVVSSGRGAEIALRADRMSVTRGAQIVTLSFASASPGSIHVEAGELSLSRRGTINASAQSGPAGDVDVRARAVGLRHDSLIFAGTISAFDAGDVRVTADVVRIASGSLIGTGSSGGATGNSGNVTVRAASALSILDGALLASASDGPGASGNISIDAGHVVVSGAGSRIVTGTEGENGGGPGGRLDLRAHDVLLSDEGNIFGGTQGSGRGGELAVTTHSLTITSGASLIAVTTASGDAGNATIVADRIVMRGRDADDPTDSTTAIAAGSLGGSGRGGRLTVRARSIRLENAAVIAVGTSGAGEGGDASIVADRVRLDRSAILAGSSVSDPGDPPATGNAGSIDLTAHKHLDLRNRSLLTAQADIANGGDITIRSPRVLLRDSQISAKAGGTGGKIDVTAQTLLYLFNSQINAEGRRAIGNITIDPIFTVLNQSKIVTDTRAPNGGDIGITTERLLKTDDSVINARQGTTTVTQLNPDLDVSGSLVPVSVGLFDRSMGFAEQCPQRLESDVSSFLITSSGALPVQPGGLLPSLELRPAPATRPVGR